MHIFIKKSGRWRNIIKAYFESVFQMGGELVENNYFSGVFLIFYCDYKCWLYDESDKNEPFRIYSWW